MLSGWDNRTGLGGGLVGYIKKRYENEARLTHLVIYKIRLTWGLVLALKGFIAPMVINNIWGKRRRVRGWGLMVCVRWSVD